MRELGGAIGSIAVLAICVAGCRTSAKHTASIAASSDARAVANAPAEPTAESSSAIKTVAYQAEIEAKPLPAESIQEEVPGKETVQPELPEIRQPEQIAIPEETVEPETLASSDGSIAAIDPPDLVSVIESVRNHFPTVRQAIAHRQIASGKTLAAFGAFDRKLSGYGNIQPLDFFENHWHTWGVKRKTQWGGEVGFGYKLGRGSFEPWYLERETNDLGEFSVSLSAPIGRDVEIDANRSKLWQAQLQQNLIEPLIKSEIIKTVNKGTKAYWVWVAASENYKIAESVLQLGLDRVEFLQGQFELGEKAKIDIVDNRRVIVARRAKLIDARRKLEQSAVKLSLYLRDATGQPLPIGLEVSPPGFPPVQLPDQSVLASDLEYAQLNRPELAELVIMRKQMNIAYRQAKNETRTDVDGGLFLGQDVGNPTSSDNKSDFEVELTLAVEVPLERRKALGKIRELQAKFRQLNQKRQFANDKIATEVHVTRAALLAAAERVEQTTEGVDLARQMQEAERERFDLGQSTLFNLNIREKQAADAASDRIAALLEYYVAKADYEAAMGNDRPEP